MDMGKSEGHVVLYRKYRSRSFDEVVGQDHIVKPLQQATTSGRVAHAYLFTGPRGTGKTSVARIFAYAINNFDYDDQLLIDIIEIDGASNRRIDEVRELKERIHVTPVQAKYKVYIIDEVHMLTKEAFNALLKTLEEPPEHAVFILATTEMHKLPATIISRTQRYAFKLVSNEEVISHLKNICDKEGIKYEVSALEAIAEMGQGGMRDSISLLDQVSSLGDITLASVTSSLGLVEQSQISELLSYIESGTPKEIVSALQEILLAGTSASQIIKQVINTVRQKDELDDNWLDLLDNLIDSNASLQPEISLEIALLKTNLRLNPSAKLLAKPIQQVAQKIEPLPKTSQTEDAKIPKRAKVSETSNIAPRKALKELDGDAWQEILNKVKSKNNALHSVLRMAKPEYEDGKLVLQFKFEFHQKQIASSKTLIIDAASDVIGQTIELETSINKELEVKTRTSEEPLEPQPAGVSTETKSVIDAFGGGEVVSI